MLYVGSDNVITDVMTNIFGAYAYIRPNVTFFNPITGISTVTYAASGVNEVGLHISNNTATSQYDLQFGMSDLALISDQVTSTPDILALPLIGFAIAPIYNLPEVNNLVLDRTTLADIFTARITQW